MSAEAEHGLNLIPNSPIVRETYGLDDSLQPTRPREADRRRGDPVRRGLGLRDLRRVRRGLPGAHRARRQDRRPAAEPRPRGIAVPAGAHGGVPEHGAGPEPVGPAAVDAHRLDDAACRSRFRRSRRLPAEGRLGEIEVLYWVGCAAAFDDRNRRVARAFATCLDAAGVRFAILGQEESCTGDPARRMGNEYVYQMLATANIETLDRYGLKLDRDGLPALLQHDRERVPAVRRPLRGRPPLGLPAAAARRRPAADGGRRRAWGRVTLHDPCYLTRYNGVERPQRTCSARSRASNCVRWSATAARRSAAAPAAAGCGWRSSAARGSTRSARARRSRRERTRSRRPARSA